MSNNFENDLQKEIADQMPFISELMETEIVAHEYTDTKFELSFGMAWHASKKQRRRWKGIQTNQKIKKGWKLLL